jgi:hypothetical protein
LIDHLREEVDAGRAPFSRCSGSGGASGDQAELSGGSEGAQERERGQQDEANGPLHDVSVRLTVKDLFLSLFLVQRQLDVDQLNR